MGLRGIFIFGKLVYIFAVEVDMQRRSGNYQMSRRNETVHLVDFMMYVGDQVPLMCRGFIKGEILPTPARKIAENWARFKVREYAPTDLRDQHLTLRKVAVGVVAGDVNIEDILAFLTERQAAREKQIVRSGMEYFVDQMKGFRF